MANLARLRSVDASAFDAEVEVLSRDPHRAMLSAMLGAAPSPERLREFAERHPDRWVAMLATITKLSGYSDAALDINLNLRAEIATYSDAQLIAKLAEMGDAMKATIPGIVETEPEPTPTR